MKKIYFLFILMLILFSGISARSQSCSTLNITSTTGSSVCGEGSVTLEAASSESGDGIVWYTSSSGGTSVGVGSVFETPVISTTTSYWAAEVINSGNPILGDVETVFTGGASNSLLGVGSVITFAIENSNANPVTITDIDNYMPANTTREHELWYHPTDISGSPSAINSSNGWMLATSEQTSTSSSSDGISNIFSNVSITIPASTTYRFALVMSDHISGSTTFYYWGTNSDIATPNNFTDSGVSLLVGDNSAGGSGNVGYGGSITSPATNTPRAFYGKIYFSGINIQCESPRVETVATVNNIADKEISNIPYTDTDDTANFDNNYLGSPGSGCSTADSYLDGNDVVYHFTSVAGQVVDIEMTGITGNDASVFVYESCDEIGESCLTGAVNDGVSTDFLISEFVMKDNTEYYIVVSSSDDPATIGYTLSIDQSNINCADYTEGPEANETLYFEAGETLADLDVTGANLTWYTNAAGTTSVAETTTATDAMTYWVSQTLNGCESNLVEVDLEEVDCSNYAITSVADDTVTCFGIANLSAQASGNGSEIYWYDSQAGGEVVNQGNSFETPLITQTTSYWVSEVFLGGSVPEYIGPNPLASSNDPSYISLSNSYSNNTYYTEFNALQNTTLSSVDIYPSASVGSQGSIVVEDDSGSLIQEVTYTTTVTNSSTSDLNVQTVPLDIPLVQGQSYRIRQGSALGLYRSISGATYPYASQNLEITGNNFSLGSDYLYFFYNWQVGSADVLCESPRKEVVASVVQTGDKVVGSLPYVDTDSTSNFGNSFSGTPGSDCGSSENYLNGDDVIYTFTATNTELIDITLSDLSDFYASVFVYESCSDIGSGCVAGAVAGPSDSDFGISAFEVTAGQEYYILVSSWLVSDIDYTLTIAPFTCNNLEQPDAPTEQEFVAGSELSELEADVTRTDATLNWYSDSLGTNPIPETTVLVDNTTYYASQTFGACESDLLAITVYEIDCAVLGIANTIPDTVSCRGEAVLEAVSSGNETEIRWYSADVDGSLLGTGETFTTPEIIETTSYWVTEVIIFNENVVCEAPRQEVVATVTQTGDVSINYSNLPYSVTDNTGNYGNDFEGDPGNGCSGSDFLDGYEVIYQYTEDTSGDNILNISLADYSKFNTSVFIYESCGEIGENCIEGATNDQGEVHLDDYYINAGETIYIVVSTDSGTTNYNLEINGVDCNNVELPETANVQPYFASPSTVADLNVSGNPYNTGLNWYSDQAATISIPTSTSLVDNTTYYVTQTILGCESSTLAITPQEFPCNNMGITNLAASEDMICVPGGEVTLTAEGSGVGNQIYWYDAATGGNLVGVGDEFTPNITETTSYWASEIFVEGGSGNLTGLGLTNWSYSSSTSAASNYWRGLYFRADESFTIYTTDVYDASSGGGTANIQLYDTDTNTMIESTTVTLPGGGSASNPVQVTLTLNFDVPGSGNYKLVANDSPAMKYEYNTVQLPISLGNYGEILEGGYSYTSGLNEYEYTYSNYYYYFYNWSIGTGVELCQSSREEVTVTVNDEIPYAPTGFTLQEFCESDFDRDVMIQDLEAIGQDLHWYASNTSSDVLAPTTVISNGSIYYATQTIATCESERRLNVTVIVNEASSLPDAATNQSFSQGETLEDLDVNGDNLIWYLDEDRTQEVEDLSEIELQDQETYYVTQNSEGYCESNVLGVTVHQVLSVNGEILEDLVYYPNPAQDVLHIRNSSNIKSVIIYNLLGQEVLKQQPMYPEININVSELPTAGYLLKITTTEDKVGMYKLLKE